MTDDIPQWALERAAELANKEAGDACFTAAYMAGLYLGEAFARYIAQHEEPPVDPVLKDAREIAAKHYERLQCFDQARSGMSLRDYFAGQALTGLLAHASGEDPGKSPSMAYKLADAMLAEREKGFS